jgi:hypothetical protein
MSSEFLILSIEAAPGDPLRAIEQPNGDLLLPAGVRPAVEAALLAVEQALVSGLAPELDALAQAKRLLGMEHVDLRQDLEARNLLKVQQI